MDSKLLAALNNLSDALEQIAKSLNDKSENSTSVSVADALKSGNFIEQIKSIDIGVKELQKDSKKILKNQETIIALSKSGKDNKSAIFEESGDKNKKEKIKSGLGTILLIATGVLAIGIAFKLIGSVDFVSVIALSIALPLIAKSFEMISEMKLLNTGQMLKLSAIMITMSITIVAASYILSYTRPVGLYQLTTAVAIATVFTTLSHGLKKLTEGIKDVNLKTIVTAPLILIAMSLAIAGASLILAAVQPVGLFQLFTAVGIAAVFVVMSYGLGKLVGALKDIDLKSVLLMPLVLITMSLAITGSSYILSQIQVIPLSTLINIAFQAVALAIVGIVLGFSMMLLSKMGINNILNGGVALVAIAATVMTTSLLISMGNYSVYPSIDWILGVGASMLAFGLGAVLLGNMITQVIIGSVALIAIAATVIAVDKILSFGDYKTYPSFDWILSVGTGMLAFGLGAALLSALIAPVIIGSVALIAIAATVMAVDKILSLGGYKVYPSDKWIKGVGSTMLTFGTAAAALGLLLPMILLGGISISMIAGTILSVDAILSRGEFKKYPSLDYAQGVSKSLAAFGKTLSDIGLGGIFLNTIGSVLGTGPLDIATQIVQVNAILSTSDFNKYPSLDWVNGTTTALTSFASIASSQSLSGIVLSNIGSLFGTGPVDIAKQIIQVDKELSKGSFIKFPPKGWIEGVMALTQIGQMFASLSSLSIDDKKLSSNIAKIANSYDRLATSLKNLGSTINNLDLQKITAIKNLTGSIVLMSLMDPTQFGLMMDALDKKSKILGSAVNDISTGDDESNRAVKVTNVKTSSTKNDKEATLTDVYMMLSLLKAESTKTNSALSSLINEVRSNDGAKLKNKK